eukprot:9794263-Karenia_brevis.AAC.1
MPFNSSSGDSEIGEWFEIVLVMFHLGLNDATCRIQSRRSLWSGKDMLLSATLDYSTLKILEWKLDL